MISRNNRMRKANVLTIGGLMLFVLCFFTVETRAEERKFVVMLAHSPKAFVTNGVPGLPPGGLMSAEIIRKEYFDRIDPNLDSFAEYWEEISYGDVKVSGDVFEWVSLPWAIEPNGPNHPARNSPADYIDLFAVDNLTCRNAPVSVPLLFSYGAGEVFCDCVGTGDTLPAVTRDKCGALIINDLVGEPVNPQEEPERGPGLIDSTAVGINVWTPGERFVDVDGDMRWDGIDEKNDMMCHGLDGCQGICSAMICEPVCVNGPKDGELCNPAPGRNDCGAGGLCVSNYCSTEADCLPGIGCKRGSLLRDRPCDGDDDCGDDETCGDEIGSGPRGCDTLGCGDLFMPCINLNGFDNDNECGNPQGADTTTESGCTPPNFISCLTDADCPGVGPGRCRIIDSFGDDVGICDPAIAIPCTGDEVCANQTCDMDAGFCNMDTLCIIPRANVDVDLPDCCAEDLEVEPLAACKDDGGIILCDRYPSNPDCDFRPIGVVCGAPRLCCEFDDVDVSRSLSVVEPFEDFLVRWNPDGATPGSVWTRVDRDYIKNNYPGDVPALLARSGNGYYESSDLFFDHLDADGDPEGTKMMQDAGVNSNTWKIPKPGTRTSYVTQADEPAWFDSWWTSRYGSAAPSWPGGPSPGRPNGVRMRAFDPAAPNPPVVGSLTDRRWFAANTGGWDGLGRGTQNERLLTYDLGGNEWDDDILPEEEFGYYDGWVEHDDLASSRYHRAGDKRLGEVTSPVRDTIDTMDSLPAIFGDDLGPHDPQALSPSGDSWCVAAGPHAINIHGEKGYDAGDVCLVEWLTWRRDGTSPTVTRQWETEIGRYHPFATPSSTRFSFPFLNTYRPSGRCSASTSVACLVSSDCPTFEACIRPQTGIGFRDYNLDGMIDQGEVRPELSANYVVDSDPDSANDGTHSEYPFNRSRLTEDVVEALDPSIDWDNFVDPNVRPGQFTVSGIVLVPTGSYTAADDPFPSAPSLNWAIYTQDTAFDPRFHDLVICQSCRDFPSAVAYAAHEYLHSWEGYPDLYDYDVFDEPATAIINCPMGFWDIMERHAQGLVHPSPPLKEVFSGWIEPVNLKTILTPGVETTLTLPPAELVRDGSYFFLENDVADSTGLLSGERYYLWAAGAGTDSIFPGSGMLIMKTNDFRANSEALALQQRTDPFNYRIVQADGFEDLLVCENPEGNTGDFGDMWPGSSNATKFNFDTVPASIWQDHRWTGLDISNVTLELDGRVILTLKWEPTNIPSLKFTDPPGGGSVGSVFRIQYETTDVFGRTDIELFYTRSNNGIPDPSAVTATPIGGTRRKVLPGTVRFTQNWDASGLSDGQYFLFAKLTPDTSVPAPPEGPEIRFTEPLPNRNNEGDGSIAILAQSSESRLETWVVQCIDATNQKWVVSSTLTQPLPQPPIVPGPEFIATTGVRYVSKDNVLEFGIVAGATRFEVGDTFSFKTTGITDFSVALRVEDGRVVTGPKAVIVAVVDGAPPGAPLDGGVPLTVNFDALRSTDPEGLPLSYDWDFGDGSTGFGSTVSHTYTQGGVFTVTLRATNTVPQTGVAVVDITVINNSPSAVVSANPTSGAAPLLVDFNAADSSDIETTNADDLIYQWDFGDGQTANPSGVPGVVFQSIEDHHYEFDQFGTLCSSASPCLFTATLTVTDPGGASSTASVQISVGNSGPVASISVSPTNGTSPLRVTFDASGSSDADGDDIEIKWEFGDGAQTLRLPVSTIVTHEYATGTWLPKATLFDVRNGLDRGAVTVWTGSTIRASAAQPGSSDPIAAFDLDPEPPYEIGDVFTLKSNSRDRPDPAMQVTHVWNFGDGSSEDSGFDREVTHSYATAPAGGFTISLTVTDPDGNQGRTTRIVEVLSDLPDTGPGPGEEENVAPTAAFIVNTNGDPVVQDQLVQFDASGSSDPEGGVLEYRWDFGDGSRPESGSGNAFVTRTHTYAEPGTYTVLLTVSDEFNASSDTARQITVLSSAVANRPPVAVLVDGPRIGPAPFTVQLDGRLSFDPDDDPLNFIWEFSDENGVIDIIEGSGFISRTFEAVGVYRVVMKVDDGIVEGDEMPSETTEIRVTVAQSLPDPVDPGAGVPDVDPPAGSHVQRPPSVPCGFGMLMGLFVSLLGLSVMRLHRRRGFVGS